MKQPVDLYSLLMDATSEYTHGWTLKRIYEAAARDGAVAILIPYRHIFAAHIMDHIFFVNNDDTSKEGFLGYFYTLPVIRAMEYHPTQGCVVVFKMNAYGHQALEKL